MDEKVLSNDRQKVIFTQSAVPKIHYAVKAPSSALQFHRVTSRRLLPVTEISVYDFMALHDWDDCVLFIVLFFFCFLIPVF